MDKYEFNIKVEQIKKAGQHAETTETAMKIADTIDWRRVRNAPACCPMISLRSMRKMQSTRRPRIFCSWHIERAPLGKRLLYKLADLALRERTEVFRRGGGILPGVL